MSSNNAKTVFLNALEIASPEARDAFLGAQCGNDQSLRAEVEELLKHHEQIGRFGESPSVTETTPPPSIERPGAQIGPYKLLQQIGEGGMGVVYMAEQTEPVQRKVALKVIKPGMDSRQIIARFDAEKQALALMDHVNIARVLDAGTTEQGRPYFVMELVHGVPITKYCDDNRLTPRQRLELFVPVCRAIQHAHQKGIIHRDIKPSNVMVTLYDGKPVPKVIDFGVAKATEQKLTERTLFTLYGTMVGTLEYMSPEQAEMSALGVDTRSDIYSLGVLLYELLTGSTPVSSKRMKEAAYAEILRMIKEEEPPKPSTRLSESGEALASISAQRHMEPAKLSKLMRGELDWIVMKTIEKDRNRRYETASAFAADLQHYLHDEPVEACPPSVAYRFRKFVRRNKGAVAVASGVALVVLFAVAGLAVSNVLITHERNEKAAAMEAYKEQLDRTEDILHLTISDESEVVSWSPVIMNDDDEIHPYLLPDEAKVFRMRLAVYKAYVRRIPDSDLGVAGLGTAEAYARAAWMQLVMGELRESEANWRLVIPLFERLARENPAAPEYRTELSDGYVSLGALLEKSSRLAEAESAYRESIRLAEVLFTQPEQPKLPYSYFTHDEYVCNQLVWANIALGRLSLRTGRLSESEVAYRQALVWLDRRRPIYQVYGESCLRLTATGGLAQVLNRSGRSLEAEQAHRQVCATWEKVLASPAGDRYCKWNLAAATARFADFLREHDREPEAGEAYQRALKMWEDLAATFPTVPAYPRQLAWFLAVGPVSELRDPMRAVTLARKAVELAPADANNWVTLAAAHYRTGNWGEAQAALDKATSLRSWGARLDWFLLALVRWQAGDKVGARQSYEKAVAWMAKNDVYNDDLRRIRAEAADLLEMNEKQEARNRE